MSEGVNNLDVSNSPNQLNLTVYSRAAYMNYTTSTLALNSSMSTHSYVKKNFSCIVLWHTVSMLDFRFVKTNSSGVFEMGSIDGSTFMTPTWDQYISSTR